MRVRPSRHNAKSHVASSGVSAAAPQTSLRLALPSERFASLLRQQADLLKKIAQQKKELERLEQLQRDAESVLSQCVRPIVLACQQLSRELRGLFRELSRNRTLGKRALHAVAVVQRALQSQGLLSSDDNDEPSADPDEEPGESFHEPETSSREQTLSARHEGGEANNESLRALFKRLAVALHPDRVQDDAEKRRRTEAMKAVTRAYESGDFATLLQVERTWALGAVTTSPQLDEKARCALLERAVGELQAQLKVLRAEAKEVRRTGPLQFFPRGAKGVGPAALKHLVADAEQELAQLTKIRDLVLAFKEGRITLSQFLEGPSAGGDEPEDLYEALLVEMLAGSVVRRKARPTQSRAQKEAAPAPRRGRPSARR
jgi:hypothetical protein